MLNEVENYGGVKVKSQGDVDSQNQGKEMCSNKIEFLALNEKAASKFEFVKLMHIWEDLGKYLVEILWEIVPTWVTTHIHLPFHHKIRIWHIREEENDVHLPKFNFYSWLWSSTYQIRISFGSSLACHFPFLLYIGISTIYKFFVSSFIGIGSHSSI